MTVVELQLLLHHQLQYGLGFWYDVTTLGTQKHDRVFLTSHIVAMYLNSPVFHW